MKTITLLPHTADVRLKIEADSLAELFEASLDGMNNILKENFCEEKKEMKVKEQIRIDAIDHTSLLIDFLSEVLTLSHTTKTLFCHLHVKALTENHLEAEISGSTTNSFDEDIKAVTYHEAEVSKRHDGKWETIIIFDI